MTNNGTTLQLSKSMGIRIFQFVVGLMFVGFGILHAVAPAPIVANMDALGIAWMLPIVAAVEIVGGLALIATVFNTQLGGIVSLWMSAVMIGAVFAHLRVGDLMGAIPALVFLTPCLILIYFYRDAFPIRRLRSSTDSD